MPRFTSFLLLTSLAGTFACTRDLNIPPEPGRGQVAGQVDTQGHVTPAGNPVSLVSETNVRTTQATATDGTFLFMDLQPGTYYLEVAVPGFAPLVRPGVRVQGGITNDVGTLQPTWLEQTPKAALINGKVVVNGDGDTAGGQVEFLLVLPGGTTQRVALAAIGLDGTFVQSVPPGEYVLRASHPLFITKDLGNVTVGEAESLDLTQDPIVLDINPATIAGTVLAERDGLDPIPADGAVITLGNGYTTTVDPAGGFQLQGLAGGPQTLRISWPGWHDVAVEHAFRLDPGGTTTLDPVTLALDRGAVSGSVVLADQQPAQDVSVSITGTPYAVLASPDPVEPFKAHFLLSGVPVGQSYEIQAQKAQYSRAVASGVVVSFGGTTALSPFTLTRMQGQFQIDDGVADNTAGYARGRDVTLDLSGFVGAASFRASEDPSFAGVSYQPFTGPSQAFTLEDRQGTHTVYAQYMDAGGTESPVFSSTVVLDSVPPASPSVEIAGGAAFTNVSNPLVLSLDAQESLSTGVDAVSGLSKMLLNETGGVDANGRLVATPLDYQRTYGFVRSGSAEGPQAVFAQFLDHAGNASAVVSATIVIDTLSPSGGLAIVRGERATVDGYTNSPMVTLTETAAAEPNGGYVSIKLANRPEDLATATLQPVRSVASWFIDPTGAPQKTVYAVLVDAAGNSSGQLSAGIIYDTAAPAPASATLSGASITRSTTVTLSLSAADDNALSPTQAVTVSEDPLFQGAGTLGPAPFPGSSSVNFPLSAGDGPKTLYVRFRDVAGNDATSTVSLTLDTRPPEGDFELWGTLADGTASTSLTTSATATLRITQLGASGYVVGDATLAACPASGYTPLTSSTLTIPLPGAGASREVRLCLADQAGNALGPIAHSITYDAAAPANCALSLSGKKVDGSAAPAGFTATSQVEASTTGCDATPAEIALSILPVTCTPTAPLVWQAFATPLPVILAGNEGTNTVYACVRDAARNTAAAASAGISLDTQPPTSVRITVQNDAAYFNAADYAAAGNVRRVQVQGYATGAAEWAVAEGTAPSSFATFVSPATLVLGGEGTRTVSALFRDAVGNTTVTLAQDTLFVDTVAPAAPTVTLQPGTEFTDSVAARVWISSADAETMQYAEDSTPLTACTLADVTGATPVGYQPELTFLLSPGDGLKRLCATVADAAGNSSPVGGDTVTVDTTPPTVPQIITPPQIVSSPDNTSFTVNTAPGGVSDTNFDRYDIVGGKTTQWTFASSNAATTSFNFQLASYASAPSGAPNVLRIRAVDKAGNTSESSVVITTDIVAPARVALNSLYVLNSDGQATLHWTPSTSSDVVAHKIYYGSATGQYNGQFAQQGASPISASPINRFTLSGLIDGAQTFVTVTAVDHAGNESPFPTSTTEVVLQPNVISPSQVATTSLTMTRVGRVVVDEDVAYAMGTVGSSADAGTVLQPVDLSTIVSPIQGGQIRTPAPTPPVAGTAIAFDDRLGYDPWWRIGYDFTVDGPYGFLASGTKLRIFSLLDPMTPVLIDTVDFGGNVSSQIAVRGDVAFVSTYGGRVIALSLAKLYDNAAATVPTLADVIGTVTNGQTSLPEGGALLSRSTFFQFTSNGGSYAAWNAADALDDNPATPWDNTDPKTTGSGFMVYSNPVASGNLLYASHYTGFGIHELGPAWAGGALPAATAGLGISGKGQFELLGGEAFMANDNVPGVSVVDVSDYTAPADISQFRPSGVTSALPVASYGNYLLIGGSPGTIAFAEAATPWTPHVVSRMTSGGPRHSLDGAFLVSSGALYDLNGSWPPPLLGTVTTGCSYDSVRLDDYELVAQGTHAHVVDYDNGMDRLSGTAFTETQINWPATVLVKAVKRYGSYLVAAEERSDGTYLEVFDARKIRDRNPATTFDPVADSRASYRVTTYTGYPELFLRHGRAFLTLDGTGQGLYAVDLRPAFDDNAATGLGVQANQGFIPPFSTGGNGARGVVVQGNYAYVTTASSFEIFDVTAALDNDPATLISGTVSRARVPMTGGPEAVAVHGSYAFVLQNGGPIYVVDVSTPLAPLVMATIPFQRTVWNCSPYPSGPMIPMRSSISVAGSRAYVTSYGISMLLDLE